MSNRTQIKKAKPEDDEIFKEAMKARKAIEDSKKARIKQISLENPTFTRKQAEEYYYEELAEEIRKAAPIHRKEAKDRQRELALSYDQAYY